MDLSVFHNQFRDETADNVRIVHTGIMALDEQNLSADDRQEQINAIFRAMHTIKGSARLLGFEVVGKIAHICENYLGEVREGKRELTRELADSLIRAGDAIIDLVNEAVDGTAASTDVAALLATLSSEGKEATPEQATPAAPAEQAAQPIAAAAQPAPAPAPQAPAAEPPTPAEDSPRRQRPTARQTVRVRVDRLDRLLNLAGELAVGQQTQAIQLTALDDLRDQVSQQQRALISLERELRQMRFSAHERMMIDRYINTVLNTGEQIGHMLKHQTERFGQHVSETKQLVEDLEQQVMAVRLLPASTAFGNLPRAVRDLARETSKEIALVLEGETTELDRKVIEALGDPLVHLIRNAADHGIESPDERERKGKPRQGTITVSARAVGSHASIAISDDGSGIDHERIRQSAVRKRLITPELAERLSDQEALELIFTPGFSTAQIITDISGRGVGMDVVRTNVIELGGQVQIESTFGQGTTITLVLPLTLVTTRVLLVDVGGQMFALPAAACHGTMWIYPDNVRTIEGRAIIQYEGVYAPILRLADLLDVEGAMAFPASHRTPAVIIGTAQRPLALLVDRLLDEREAVIKPMGPLMEQQRRYSGAIQFGDGRLLLLLNPTVLAQVARGMALVTRVAEHNAATRSYRLLVADDSFTTRELISSILQSAGYEVSTAVDGLDALDKLRSGPYDLVVSDVEMPRVDGFQLTSRIRQELGMGDLPVIIVTSLASENYRRRGLEVGAQAYIVKSQFDQSNLLETIRQLLGN
ncbi:hybrid sensor histidine kinase/response regulator [Chloroflexia bacterium SDU3-3]|nr:hybrid sensor histidine kinase/response regulator [Chloroflexia bacterium SDU3-3]